MMRRGMALLALTMVAIHAPVHPVNAAGPSDAEAKLREALRGAITQQRALEDERAVLLAKQAESAREVERLRQQVEELIKELEERPKAKAADYEKAVAEFNRHLAEQNDTITRLGETLEKWKGAYNEAANVARAKEAERSQLATRLADTTKQVTVCRDMNAELYKVGSEILDRYAGMGVGEAIASREPFIGFKRVELQNIVQDYQDKLVDGKVTP